MSDYDEQAKQICNQKLTWQTRELAAAAAAYADFQHGAEGGKPQPYRCRVCELWHLARA